MAFPTPGPDDIGLEYNPPGSNKTWIWDGEKWILISGAGGAAQRLDDLEDARTTNQPAKEGDLLSYDPSTSEFKRTELKDIIGDNNVDDNGQPSLVEILDDLKDVNIEDSKNAAGTKFAFYVNTDPDKADGYGRYVVDPYTNTIQINKKDLNILDVDELTRINTNGAVGHVVTFENPDIPYSATTRISEIPTVGTTGNSYIFKYDNADLIQEIYKRSVDGEAVLFTIARNEFRGLSDGAVLMYKEAPNQQWEPSFVDSGADANNITLSASPPASPKYNDIWIDSANYYMYVYTPTQSGVFGNWVAITGPGGIDGGSDIVNNSVVSIAPSRGLNVEKGGSFTLNQAKNHIIKFSPSNIVILDDVPPPPDDRMRSDVWIDTKDYKMYVWNEYQWVGLSMSDANDGAIGSGFNYIPCELDGGEAGERYDKDCSYAIDGGISTSVFCDYDDPYSEMRPGVVASVNPPERKVMGTMWFDTSRMELRVWYANTESSGHWFSAINPASAPILPPDPDPAPVRVSGPVSAVAGVASDNFTCVIGSNLSLPSFQWMTTDPQAYVQPVGTRNVVQIVFNEVGTHNVGVTVTDSSLIDPDTGEQVAFEDFVKVVVTEAPANVEVTFEVMVKFFTEDLKDAFVINNQRQPYLTLVRGRKYLFIQDHVSNNSNPLSLYKDDGSGNPDYTEKFMDGVKIGDGNTYLEYLVAADAPPVLHYDNSERDMMNTDTFGNKIYVVGEYVGGNNSFTDGLRPSLAPYTIDVKVVELTATDEYGGIVFDPETGEEVKQNVYSMLLTTS